MQLTPSRQGYREDLNLALVIADSVDALTMSRFQSDDLKVDTKPDMTPVSDADRAAEELSRQQLKRARPRDAVTGEEYGTTGWGKRRWIIDPIDGTKNFVRGVPVWATLISLVDGDRPVVGVVSAPALSRRWWAYEDGGAYTGKSLSNAVRIHASDIREISDASLSFSSLEGWRDRGNISEFLQLTSDVWRVRAYGDFWSYMLVAEGAVDIACEPELELYDMAALVPIVTEAGGTFTSLDGEPGPWGGHGLATNAHLHPEVLERLNPALRGHPRA